MILKTQHKIWPFQSFWSIQFSAINDTHDVVQSSPLSISRLFLTPNRNGTYWALTSVPLLSQRDVKLLHWLSNSMTCTPNRHISRYTHKQIHICQYSQQHYSHSAKRWNNLNIYPSIDDWTYRRWHVHTIERMLQHGWSWRHYAKWKSQLPKDKSHTWSI